MDDKIQKLIDKLELSSECIKTLEDSKLEKIIANKEKTSYCFYITVKNILPIELYKEFSSKLKESFPGIKNVSCILSSLDNSLELLQNYFIDCMDELSKTSSMLNMFKESKIEVIDNNLIIYVDNVAELKKLEEYKLVIEEYLNRVREGFHAVTTKSYGLGRNYIDASHDPSGKTGTSQSFTDSNGDGKIDTPTVSTAFIGYAPTDNPKMSITVTSPNSSLENSSINYSSMVTRRISKSVSDIYFNLYP